MSDEQYVLVEPKKAPTGFLYKVFTFSAIIGIIGWLVLLSMFIFWTLQPVTLPTFKQPIEVLNTDKEVAIGETLVLKLEVFKPEEISPVGVTRFFECESGNLVTLTTALVSNLPTGEYEIISNNIDIPAKITPGDNCKLVLQARYQINPIKSESTRFVSEQFLVLPVKE